MITFPKTDDSSLQDLLDEAKTRGEKGYEKVYREGPVYNQVKLDFKEKCYLCEDDEATSIQMEHFNPHQGDLDKKYDWNNLFYSCGHCNNLKGAQYWPLLNCTSSNDKVWESVELKFHDFPKTRVEVIAHPQVGKEVECSNTCELLRKTLNGEDTTAMKKDEAKKLRKKMLRAHKMLADNVSSNDKVKELISIEAPFAGMQRWTLKNDYPEIFDQVG